MKYKMISYIQIVALCSSYVGMLMSNNVMAQSKLVNPALWAGHISYGIELPFGDLKDRFGTSFQLGLGLERITDNNLIWGADWKYLFGDNVNEDPLAPLRNIENEILGVDNNPAVVFLRERGMYLGVVAGKLFPLHKNSRSGIRATIGAGMFYHYIRLQDDTNSVPQIAGDYAKGYDRKSLGPSLKQQVFYQYLQQDKKINFYIGLEFLQGFTHNIRPIDFDTQMTNDVSRFDMILGFKVGWILPIYSENYEDEEIFY